MNDKEKRMTNLSPKNSNSLGVETREKREGSQEKVKGKARNLIGPSNQKREWNTKSKLMTEEEKERWSEGGSWILLEQLAQHSPSEYMSQPDNQKR